MSLLDLSLLGLLADQPLHGYELSKRLRDLGRGAVSYGALYPALARLDRKGLITAATPTRDVAAAPMTGSLGAEVARLSRGGGGGTTSGRSRRRRKVYRLTPAGETRLRELLAEPPTDDRTFATQLAFASHLAPQERLVMLEQRRGVLTERLADDPTTGFLDRYRKALHERDRLADTAEVEWLDHLIDAERADDPSPSPAGETVDEPTPRTVGGSIR